MSTPRDLIDGMQSDLVAKIASDPFFADIALVDERLGTTETDVDNALKLVNATSGKLPGVAVIVGMPLRTPTGAQQNLYWNLATPIRVVEIPRINRQPGGNGKYHSTVSIALEDLLHQWLIGEAACVVGKVGPFMGAGDDGEVGFDLILRWEAGQRQTPQCRRPTISGTSAGVSIANSESGATVYFTTDGSLPTPTNGTAYTTPFTSDVGTLIRAAAYLAGKRGSDVHELTLTI